MIFNIFKKMGLCEGTSCSSFRGMIIDLLAEDPRSPFLDIMIPRCESYQEKFLEESGRQGYLPKLAAQVREIKEKSLERLDELIRTACENIEDNKGQCYIAKDSEGAREIISDIVGKGKVVIKSLNPTLEEVEIGPYLAKNGNDVCEATLGSMLDDILALSRDIKVDVKGIANYLGQLIEESLDASEESIVSAVNHYLRERFQRADVGISGVTALAADPGALFLVSTRGVNRLITMTPTIHIALVGIDELVPSYSDAFKVSEFLLRVMGGSPNLAVVGGPSKTGDIEKKVTYGAHGPKELHVVFLDNGRRKAMEDPVLREALYCLKCGGVHSLTMLGIWNYITAGDKELISKCLEVGCSSGCPLGIDLRKIVEYISRR